MIGDPDTGESHKREVIEALLSQEKSLRERLGANDLANVDSPSTGRLTARSYVGEAEEFSTLESILANPKWASLKAHLRDQLSVQPEQMQQQSPPTPATLPSRAQAHVYLSTYLNEFHVQKPFLSRQHVWNLLDDVYAPKCTAHALFQFYMICAVSAVKLHGRVQGGDNCSPFNFFAAAQRYRNDVDLANGTSGIQNLLLLARFGAYHQMGQYKSTSTKCVKIGTNSYET
jgi:hypothetical protein